MKILELGAEGGCITIEKHGEKYLLLTNEHYDNESYSNTTHYDTVRNAWQDLMRRYAFWPQFYPMYISPEIAPLIREVISKKTDLMEPVQERWNECLEIKPESH